MTLELVCPIDMYTRTEKSEMCLNASSLKYYLSMPVLQVSSNEYSLGFFALNMTSTVSDSRGRICPNPSLGCTSTHIGR